MSGGTIRLDLALSITTAGRAPSCHGLLLLQPCSLAYEALYQRLGCNDKRKRSTSSSLSPCLSKSALSAGMLHAASAAYSLRALPCLQFQGGKRCAPTIFHRHVLGSLHGYEHRDFPYGSLQTPL